MREQENQGKEEEHQIVLQPPVRARHWPNRGPNPNSNERPEQKPFVRHSRCGRNLFVSTLKFTAGNEAETLYEALDSIITSDNDHCVLFALLSLFRVN